MTDFQLTDLKYTNSFRQAVNNAAVQKANIEVGRIPTATSREGRADREDRGRRQAKPARQAAGAADARLLQATAEAKAIQLQGEAQAAAIRAQADALKANSNLVELRRAERWDGKLPVNVYGSAPIPFMGIQQ